MSFFDVTYSCGHTVPERVASVYVDEPERLAKHIERVREQAEGKQCRRCVRAARVRAVAGEERRIGLPSLADTDNDADLYVRSREVRARVCSALNAMDLDERSRVSVAELLRRARGSATWRGGAYCDAGRLLKFARSRYRSVGECAEILGVSAQRVRKMLSDGLLEGMKTRSGWLVDSRSVEERARAKRASR